MTQLFGPHLMLDLKGCNSNISFSLDKVYEFLFTTPDIIGMEKVTMPYVFPYYGKIAEDDGITGCVVIAESHISIHTFPKKEYVFVDVFSCKPFDVDLAIEHITKYFECDCYDKYLEFRGKGFR